MSSRTESPVVSVAHVRRPALRPARRSVTVAVTLAVTVVVTVSIPFVPGSAALAAPCWLPPVAGVVTDPFREPPCPWCAGNRGVEYRVAAGTRVRSVAAGIVTFSGVVAGVRYVVVRHADGRRITYGHLTSTSLTTGDRVVSRSVVGVADGTFHLGVRVGGRYVDPTPLLGRLVGRPRLIPTDGSAARAAPAPTVRCPGAARTAPATVGPGTRRR